MTFQPELLEKIKKCQEDVMDQDINRLVGEELCTQKDDQGILRFSSRIWIPLVTELKNEILQEAHNSRYSIHPGSTKSYAHKRMIKVYLGFLPEFGFHQ